MKEDLAGGKFPSGLFGANAAWWQIMILAFNLNIAMKILVLGGDWVKGRLKAIRFWLIKVPGRVLEHARSLIVRRVGGHPSNEILFEMRRGCKFSGNRANRPDHGMAGGALSRAVTR
jgi:hypothetical protein